MTLSEYSAALRGYAKIQSGKPDPMTDEDFDAGLDALRRLNLPDMRI